MKRLKIGLALALAIFGTGCVVVSKGAGLPSNAKLVGGGLAIHWQAPANGTAILVEKNSQKTVATQTLNEGEAFEFDIAEPEKAEVIRSLFDGRFPENGQYLLYFAPSR